MQAGTSKRVCARKRRAYTAFFFWTKRYEKEPINLVTSCPTADFRDIGSVRSVAAFLPVAVKAGISGKMYDIGGTESLRGDWSQSLDNLNPGVSS